MLLAALVAGKVAHILHQPQHGDLDVVEHIAAPDDVGQGHGLGRGDQHRTGRLDKIGQGDQHITRPWRDIHDDIVQLSPVNIPQKLL